MNTSLIAQDVRGAALTTPATARRSPWRIRSRSLNSRVTY